MSSDSENTPEDSGPRRRPEAQGADSSFMASTKVPYAQVWQGMLWGPHAVSGDAVKLYAILDRRIDNREGADTEGYAFPGRQWLADTMALSLRKVDNLLAELKRSGWVTVTRRGLKRSNLYTLHDRPVAAAKVQVTPDLHAGAGPESHAGAGQELHARAGITRARGNESKGNSSSSSSSTERARADEGSDDDVVRAAAQVLGMRRTKRELAGGKVIRTPRAYAAACARDLLALGAEEGGVAWMAARHPGASPERLADLVDQWDAEVVADDLDEFDPWIGEQTRLPLGATPLWRAAGAPQTPAAPPCTDPACDGLWHELEDGSVARCPRLAA